MNQIIAGLQIDIEAAELKTLLLGRLDFHETKVQKYEGQYKDLAAIDAGLAEEAEGIGKYGSNTTAADAMKATIKTHSDSAVYFRFMVDHVIKDATYRLSEADLVRIGVRSRGF